MPLLHLFSKPKEKRLFALIEDGVMLQSLSQTKLYPVHLLAFAANEIYPNKDKDLWAIALKTELLGKNLVNLGSDIILEGPIQGQWIEKRERLGKWQEGYNLPFEFLEYIDLDDAPK